ncbi:MAG: hypothetical protein MUF54_09755 [Polyangiaceae bacterium]|jgi:hypothetical protein|nr:hypothetical protein [Polyangiaceae bacterium]
MNEAQGQRVALVIGMAAVAVSCGGKPDAHTGGRGAVEDEFNRCVEQEKYGDAKGCWHAFLDRFGEVAGAAERAYAQEHLQRGAPTPAAGAPPQDDAVARAVRTTEGLVRLPEKGGGGGSADGGQFPPQRVGFQECYRGFQISGDSERDMQELGNRCGAPCGMLPLSNVMAGSQDESDNVDQYGVSLRGDRCYRFFAVGSSSIQDLDSAIATEDGNIIMRDVFNDAAPILGPDQPFCPPSEGRYKFVVSVSKGSGPFHFQVWQGPRP